MTPRYDPLAQLLVNAACELGRRWPYGPSPVEDPLLVRVPTEVEPVTVSVLADDDEDHGSFELMVLRGPDAFARVACDGRMEGIDRLSYALLRWEEVPVPCCEILLAAGVPAWTKHLVPWFLAEPPYEDARVPERRELRTLAWVVQGLLATHAAGELWLSPGTREDRKVLSIEVSGGLRRPSATARILPWPAGKGPEDPPASLWLPDELRDLPRTTRHWLLACVPIGVKDVHYGLARSRAILTDRSGELIGWMPLPDGDLRPLADMLVDAFVGERVEEEPGLPCVIVFNDERAYAALAPALEALDVAPALDADDPDLRALIEKEQPRE